MLTFLPRSRCKIVDRVAASGVRLGGRDAGDRVSKRLRRDDRLADRNSVGVADHTAQGGRFRLQRKFEFRVFRAAQPTYRRCETRLGGDNGEQSLLARGWKFVEGKSPPRICGCFAFQTWLRFEIGIQVELYLGTRFAST